MSRKFFRPRLTVTAEMPDGTEVEVDLVGDMRDQAKYERARRHLNLPKIGDEGMLSFMMGTAYFALTRSKSPIVEGCSLSTWLDDRCIMVEMMDDEGNPTTDQVEGSEPVDPSSLAMPPG